MSEKTKKLLDNLNKITQKPKSQFEREKIDVITNRYYIPDSIHTLPKSYNQAKRYKDETWLDGEYIMIDRVYSGLSGQRLTQRDGTTYKGKLYDKRRLIKNEIDDKNFYSKCTVTTDGRWFDNCGFPIETPKEVEVEKKEKEEHTGEMWSSKPSEEDIEEQKRIAREKEQRIIAGLK